MAAQSKLTPELGASIADAIRAGASMEDVAREHQVGLTTLKRWIARGRGEDDGLYRDFADEYDLARTDAPITDDECIAVLTRAARHGSIRAAQLLLERPWEKGTRADSDSKPREEDPLAAIDELAERRRATN